MKLTQGIPAGSSGAVSLNQTWQLTTANSGEGRRYQQRFTIQLPTAGVAEDLLLNEATDLRVRASSYSFNALATQSPERAQVSRADDHQGLLITLPVARLIARIRFHSSVAPGGKTTQLFRTDGDVIAEEAVASAYNSSSAIARSDKVSKAAQGTGVSATKETAAGASQNVATHEDAAGKVSKAQARAGGELDVLDSRVVVRLRGASGFVDLVVANLSEVNLDSKPENLRIGLRLPALGTEVFYLPLIVEPDAQVNAGGELRAQLADLLQRLRDELANEGTEPVPVLPNPLAVELVAESDAPCRLTISQFAIDYELARQSFPDSAPKQVLRFPKGQLARRQVSLQIPAAVTLTGATLTLAGNATAGGPGAPVAFTPGELNATVNAAGAHGLRVDAERQWASSLELVEPMLCDALDLLLAGLASGTQLRLELLGDQDRQPGGDVLARVEATLAEPKRRQLLRFHLPEPVLLHAGSYWLTLQSREGAAVWYLQGAAGQRVLQLRKRHWEGVNSVSDEIGIATPVPAAGVSAAGRRFPEITLSGQALPLLSCDGDWVYDLGAVLAATPLAGSGLVTLGLDVLAAGPRAVTVYPPRVRFDV